jgi:hypothetical protein
MIIYDSSTDQQLGPNGPTTPQLQRLLAITQLRFSLFRVRSPLLTESRLFSFPVGTEMFHFPTFPPTALCVQAEVAGHYSGFFRGFPIRRSPDRSSFTSSPGLIAGYNVLHRLLVPRHPPIALSSLLYYKDARVHCEVLKIRAGHQTSNPKALKPGPQRRPPQPPPPTGSRSHDRIFRTQQRVKTPPTPSRISTPTPPARWRSKLYSRDDPDSASIVNVPHSGACPTENRRLRTERNGHRHPCRQKTRCH